MNKIKKSKRIKLILKKVQNIYRVWEIGVNDFSGGPCIYRTILEYQKIFFHNGFFLQIIKLLGLYLLFSVVQVLQEQCYQCLLDKFSSPGDLLFEGNYQL